MLSAALTFHILDEVDVGMESDCLCFPTETDGAVNGWGGSPEK